MPDLMASLGLHQLKRLGANWQIRKRYWQRLDKGLSGIVGITLPPNSLPDTTLAYHLYAILIDPKRIKISRNQFIDALKAEGIGAGVHFDPIHLHSFYRKTFGFKKGDFPHAEAVGSTTLSLPFYPHMTEKDVDDVIRAVKKIASYYRR